MYLELTAWIALAASTTLIYFFSYNFANAQCSPSNRCTVTFEVHHLPQVVRYFFLLVGNVAPTYRSWFAPGHPGPQLWNPWGYPSSGVHLQAHELLGAVICVAAGYVLVQSIRQRRLRPNPLPLLLIAFGVAFDLLITESRFGEGLLLVVRSSDYTMHLFILLGIVVYTWASVPDLEDSDGCGILGAGTLAVFLIAQGILATEYGFAGAGVRHQMFQSDARVLANRERIPSARSGAASRRSPWCRRFRPWQRSTFMAQSLIRLPGTV